MPVRALAPRISELDGTFEIPQGYQPQERNVSKVRSTLRQYVREWSSEGAEERSQCFTPLIEGLKRYLPVRDVKQPPRVVCPGSGLGRLPFELAALGYRAQGNEFSYHMLLASTLALNLGLKPEALEVCLVSINVRTC